MPQSAYSQLHAARNAVGLALRHMGRYTEALGLERSEDRPDEPIAYVPDTLRLALTALDEGLAEPGVLVPYRVK